jgi:hypothetical protein
VNRLLVIVLGVWVVAQVMKGDALQRLGIISSGSAPATPAPVAAAPSAVGPSSPGNPTASPNAPAGSYNPALFPPNDAFTPGTKGWTG